MTKTILLAFEGETLSYEKRTLGFSTTDFSTIEFLGFHWKTVNRINQKELITNYLEIMTQ